MSSTAVTREAPAQATTGAPRRCPRRYKSGIHQPISLKGSLEREDLDKYMLVDVFPPLVSVTGTLVQML
uniref:Uncharacterized protein n=1 Tax=Arundo donax TaxID=35708 RepID=A0A0A9CR48_ARUDO